MRSVENLVSRYKLMQANVNNTSMYEEVKWQYIDMASGGNGGALGIVGPKGEESCREINYKGYPDSFFQQVCERMGWAMHKTLKSSSKNQ